VNRFLLLNLLGAAAVFATSCALGSYRRGGDSALASGSGGNASGGSGGDAATSSTGGANPSSSSGTTICDRATYPPKPQQSAGGDEEIVVAIRKIYLDSAGFETDFGSPLGLDLDGLCTCTGDDGDSCQPPGDSACDLPNGRDNSISGFIGTLANFLPGNNVSNFYSAGIGEGSWSLLIRISGYNGMPDDDQVTVATYVASNLNQPPQWDGNDAWPISASSVKGNDIDDPAFVDPDGYVSNGQVVASLPRSEMVVSGSKSQLSFIITGGGILAPLTQGPNGWEVNGGMLLGRVKESDLFYALSTYRDSDGEGFCTTDFTYSAAKDILCKGRDIHTEVVGPTAPCNANSLAAGFVASPAKFGGVTPAPPPTPGCSPAADPINDACDS
jgi:hypothetical protein